MNLLIKIQKQYNTFTEKEKSIANFIFSNKGCIENTNITDLAQKTETSTATITRFCKKIGCDNFVDMKINLHTVDSQEVSNVEDTVFSNVHNYYREVIKLTTQLIDKDSIYRLVEYIQSARNIYIYGMGSSGLSAIEMMQRLLRMGFNVHAISDSHRMIINSAIVLNQDLVIGISISGETKEVVHSLKRSKKNGAKTIAITSFENSQITNYSDETFLVHNSSFVDRSNFINSQFSTMYLLDLVCTVLLKNEEYRKNFQITVDAIINS